MSIIKFRLNVLKIVIDLLKICMIRIGNNKGFSHPLTVRCSQVLDTVLNRYRSVRNLQ
ncbi:Spo0E family sporulation regulatory protein-aspartic acid phosphatase [Virgibacillus flavescens]|uniref:Spo0E family sporulation regulatory protein-aspartic acid phosphatase n=1 Tax=Virgibacillus flavescens TaxID=1611422 RepID=UPI003D32D914